MSLTIVHSILLACALLPLLVMTLLKPRRIEYLLFGLLCLSLIMLAISGLLPSSFHIEQQFVALGTFATCNVFWLLSRALFRKHNPLSIQHYVLAGFIALLILFSRTIDLFVGIQWLEADTVIWIKRSLSELLRLLSSAILILAFWESIQGFSKCSKASQQQRVLFASSMVIAVFSTRIVVPAFTSEGAEVTIYLWVRAFASTLIILSTFIIILWQFKLRKKLRLDEKEANNAAIRHKENEILVTKLIELMESERPYLNSELKIIDLANRLDVSEYRVSRAIRENTDFENVNHFINWYRIEHAKRLLTSKEAKYWTVLVISMESGFASLASFNRAFKNLTGYTPNQYRTQPHLQV